MGTLTDAITSEKIFRCGVTLLAFVMAFYALVARERKTPYMVHSVYKVSFFVLLSLTTSIAGEIFTSFRAELNLASLIILIFSLIYVIVRLWKEHNRHVYFRDDQLLLNLSVVRRCRAWKRKLRKSPAYEHNPMVLPPPLIESLKDSPFLPTDIISAAVKHHENSPQLSMSAALEINSLVKADEVLCDIAIRFLKNNCFIQYTCCSRHPLEWLLQIKHRWENEPGKKGTWNEQSQRIVLVDAYTPHFGFTDSIYTERSVEAKKDCIDVIEARQTFAGVHTAIAEAFNEIKKKDDKLGVRSPALVIYEGCQSLADLESHEQYRIFLRHVIPSERLWGGMFTLFIESSLSEENAAVLESLTHAFVKDKAPPESPILPN